MKALLLAPELLTTDSGIPRLLRTVLQVLCDLAGSPADVSLVALNDVTIPPRPLPGLAPSSLRSWKLCGGHKGAFVRATLQAAPHQDLLVCGHVAQSPVAWLARCRNRRLRYVVMAHGIEVWRRLGVWQRLALRGADQVWCVSDYTRRQLLAHNAVKTDRVLVVPSGLDRTFSMVADPTPFPRLPVILAVSRLSPTDRYKGIDHLIEALPAVRAQRPDARLHIIGRGADRRRLQTLAQRRNPGGAVMFAGYMPDAWLRAAVGQAALFALPSAGEGFGLVYVEALAVGTPCLGTPTGGATEIITPETGLLVPYGDIPALANALVDGLRRPWNPGVLVERARHFSYEAYRARIAAALDFRHD
jgi:phosphatidyl-myo-inositol dimannoside synthase